MTLEGAVSAVFVSGVEVGPALDPWLAGRPDAVVKLPFTVWYGVLGVEGGVVGRSVERPSRLVTLVDARLGISLHDRLSGLCPDADRCVVWLSGRFHDDATFSVHGVHGLVTEPTPLAAVQRAPACLAIRRLSPTHCARGSARCATCAAAEAQPPTPHLLDLCPEGPAARPTIAATRDGATHLLPYDVLRAFADTAEARAFATAHGITDLSLE